MTKPKSKSYIWQNQSQNPLKSGTKQYVHSHHSYYNAALNILARVTGKGKK